MADFVIREMRGEDLGEVVTLVYEASEFAWDAKKIIASLNSPYNRCLLLCDAEAGDLLGYAVLHSVLDECQLLNIAILKSKQGQGLGSYFIQHVIAAAQSSNASLILLEVRASNQTAIRLYEKQGFIRNGIRKGYYPAETGREDAWLYSLSVS
jgi:ribosomal-protein-alanine N-acetyltransferase